MMGAGGTPGQVSELTHQMLKPDPSCEELAGTIIGAEASAEAGGLGQIVPAVWIMVNLQLQPAMRRAVA